MSCYHTQLQMSELECEWIQASGVQLILTFELSPELLVLSSIGANKSLVSYTFLSLLTTLSQYHIC